MSILIVFCRKIVVEMLKWRCEHAIMSNRIYKVSHSILVGRLCREWSKAEGNVCLQLRYLICKISSLDTSSMFRFFLTLILWIHFDTFWCGSFQHMHSLALPSWIYWMSAKQGLCLCCRSTVCFTCWLQSAGGDKVERAQPKKMCIRARHCIHVACSKVS